MGSGLSSNFVTAGDSFVTGCWRVHRATHIDTGAPVSLWVLDYQILKARFPSAADQTPYINGFLKALHEAKKMVHPHILKIIEVQEDPQHLEFVSEPINSPLRTLIGSLDSNESCYIGFQILDALKFLHDHAKMVHLGVSPTSILVTRDLSVKLFNFNWMAPIGESGTVETIKDYACNSSFPNIHYSAPEVIRGQPCSPQTDIFSFGAVLCEMLTGKQLIEAKTPEEYDGSVNPAAKLQGLTSSFYGLVQDCLQPMMGSRPSAGRLSEDAVFQTVPLKVLRYMDLIVAKDPKDKFEFFKSVASVVGGFSQRLIQYKVIPVMVEECEKEKKFAPILIGPILQAAKNFPMNEFTNDVYLKLCFLTTVLNPPQILIAFLQQLDLILTNVDPSIHTEKVYPILYSSLRSDDMVVVKECLKRLPGIIEKLAGSVVTKNVVPLLTKQCEKCTDAEIVAKAIACLIDCLPKVDNDMFLKYILPRIMVVWTNWQEAYLVPAMCDLLSAIKGGDTNTMGYAIPFASEIASSAVCDPYYQKQLCSWVLGFVTKYKTTRALDLAEDPRPSSIPTLDDSQLTEFFDPLAEQLSITPAQQQFDFTFGTVQLQDMTSGTVLTSPIKEM